MSVGTYWVGEIPTRPLSIRVMDEYGQEMNLSTYDGFNVKMLDTNNVEVDLSDTTLDAAMAAAGELSLVWPETYSLFTEPGEYVLQMELLDGTMKDKTSTYTFTVRQAGGVN